MDRVRQQVEAQVPGLEIELLQLLEDVIGDLTAVPQPIEIKLFGDDPALLTAAAQKIAQRIGKITGVVDVNAGVKPAGDALSIRLDPVRLALEGMDVRWPAGRSRHCCRVKRWARFSSAHIP